MGRVNKGIYENGTIGFEESAPTMRKDKVVVLFISEAEQPDETPHKGVKIRSQAGQSYAIPEDFNEPIDDLREYI
jgi:hypothetical protein